MNKEPLNVESESLDLCYEKLLEATPADLKEGKWDLWIEKLVKMERENRASWNEKKEK